MVGAFSQLNAPKVGLPFVNGNDPSLKFLLMIPSGLNVGSYASSFSCKEFFEELNTSTSL